MSDRVGRGFTGLLEAAPDAMLCVERDGRIALVNGQAEQLFGYLPGEMVGQPVEIVVPDAMREGHARMRERFVAHPRTRPMNVGLELAGRRRDGSTFPAEISLATVSTDTGLLVIAAVRDITELRRVLTEHERLKADADRARLERQVHQSQRLESLGELAGGVAHDFNNLLGVISSYASFVAEEITGRAEGDESWHSARADIEQVQRAAERAAGLTHQLLAFARREVVQPTVLNLNDIVSGVLKLLRRTLGEHVDLATQLESAPEFVLADAGQLEQVLVNLAVNARDAMPDGGTLTIGTGNLDIGGTDADGWPGLPPGRYVALTVRDTGTGMPADVAERAFEPFYTTKAKGKGTGLGLATVYGIITQAGGDIQITSEAGRGTTISALLPATRGSSEPGAQQPAGHAPGLGEQVLVVEDEDALREVARRILARNGYQVTTASSGHEALDLLTRPGTRLDALVTDVVMPGMQGRELAERVRRIQPDVRVLYMSGYTEGMLSEQGVLGQGTALIEKPFTEAGLLGQLRHVLGEPPGGSSPGESSPGGSSPGGSSPGG